MQDIKNAILSDFTGNRGMIRRWFEAQGCSPSVVKFASKSDFLACLDNPRQLADRISARQRQNPAAAMFIDDEPAPPALKQWKPDPAPVQQQHPTVTRDAVEQLQAALAALLPAQHVAAPVAGPVDADAVRDIVRSELKNWTIQIDASAPPVKLDSKPHHKLGLLVQVMALGEPAYLRGPAGSGKSTAAGMAADAFGLEFYHCGKVDSKYDLLGFVDANGTYQASSLYTAYKDGGVFLWDEVDASAPDALTAFLNLIEGQSFEFPCGKVAKHADFRPVAAGNTSMLGGTAEYTGRMRQDAAFKDRFLEIDWPYDESLEVALYGEAAEIVQDIRRKAADHGIKHIISPRASRRLQKLLQVYPRADAIELAVRNGLDAETWGRLC